MPRAASGMAFALSLIAVSACGAATAPSAVTVSPSATRATQSAAAGSSEIERIRARGTLVVAIRVEAPPANRTMGDPAHAQKRAFEIAVANLVAARIFGTSVKVEFRSQGGDRLAGLDQGVDIAMSAETPTSRDRALISMPYAASAVVLASKEGGAIRVIEDVRAQTIAVAQDELGARDIAQMFLQQRGVTATLTNYTGVNGAASALDGGQAAALVGDKIGVAVVAKERQLAVLAEIAPRPYVVATRKNASGLARAIDDALRMMLSSGEIRDAATKASFPYEAPKP